MHSDEFILTNQSAAIGVSEENESNRAARSSSTAREMWERVSGAMRSAFMFLLAAESCGFGFWLLAERQKNLGYIDVIIAVAVIIGAVFAAFGVVFALRFAADRKQNGSRNK